MNTHENINDQLAEAAGLFQLQRTGHVPESVSVILRDDTLVITLYHALSPAEMLLAKTQAGADKIQEFHRRLFAASAEAFHQEIKRITRREVREAVAEIELAAGATVHSFTTGTMVQIFHLAKAPSPTHTVHQLKECAC